MLKASEISKQLLEMFNLKTARKVWVFLHLFKKIIFPQNETFVPSFILEHSFTAELKPPIIGEK